MEHDDLGWTPERKIVGAAIATILLSVATVFSGTDLPVGLEGAVAVVVAYFLPNKK